MPQRPARSRPKSKVRRRSGRIARSAVAPDFSAREQLLDTASRLMSERCSIDVSLSEIAAHSGLNSALVKYYFGNKDGLLLALVQREADLAVRELNLLLEQSVPPLEKLRRHLAAIINNFFRRPYLNRLLHSLLDARSGEARSAQQVTRCFVRPLMDFQRKLIAQGVAAGEFKHIDPTLFYVSVLGACDHLFNARYVLQAANGRGGLTDAIRERYIEHVCDLFIHGIASPAAVRRGAIRIG